MDRENKSQYQQEYQVDDRFLTKKERRAHHTALERRRRDQIKDKFTELHKEIPALHINEKASRSDILTGASDLIQDLTEKNEDVERDLAEFNALNALLQDQISALEENDH
eukprot:CFRG4960T1